MHSLDQSPYIVNLTRTLANLQDALLKADSLMQKYMDTFSIQDLKDLADVKYQLACQAGQTSVELQFSKRKVA